MEKFTKGEWSVQPIGELSFNVCFLTKGVSVYSSVKAVNDAKHDAALIAAAPEMYALLKELSGVVDNDDIKQILAKARGEK